MSAPPASKRSKIPSLSESKSKWLGMPSPSKSSFPSRVSKIPSLSSSKSFLSGTPSPSVSIAAFMVSVMSFVALVCVAVAAILARITTVPAVPIDTLPIIPSIVTVVEASPLTFVYVTAPVELLIRERLKSASPSSFVKSLKSVIVVTVSGAQSSSTESSKWSATSLLSESKGVVVYQELPEASCPVTLPSVSTSKSPSVSKVPSIIPSWFRSKPASVTS